MYKIRCSALGMIMTEPKAKSDVLSQTAKTYLRQLYREKKYGRRKEFTNKYLQKGTEVEEDSITMLTLHTREMYVKNELRFENDFICGTPDLFSENKETVIDIKSSWDLFTLPFKGDNVDKGYFYQLQGYMALSGAKNAKLCYCLTDTPQHLIESEINKFYFRNNIEITPEIRERFEKQMKFQDIPLNEKIIIFEFERDEETINKIYQKVQYCNEYLNNL